MDKNGIFYPTACYLEIAALYRLGNYDEVVSRIPEIISKQTIKVSGKPGGLTSRQAATYEGMLHYFLMDSYIHQSGQNPAWQEKVLQVLDSFIARLLGAEGPSPFLVSGMCNVAIELRVSRAATSKSGEELVAAQRYCGYWSAHGVRGDGQYVAAEQLVVDARLMLENTK